MELCTLLGVGKSEHGTALLPHSMHVAEGLRPPNSSLQWWRIVDHTQSRPVLVVPRPCPPLLLTPLQRPGEQPRENPRTNTPHPLGSSGPAWG